MARSLRAPARFARVAGFASGASEARLPTRLRRVTRSS